ncbi:hypothetical protein D5086_030775 [Populus alba]|uniref:Uncharacterized protein n=1 Tax=Populus alba TaxID=43335 RepID=A0ACC4APF1_POPAL
MGRWMKPEVYPLLAAMTCVTSLCIFQLTRNVFMNPDVRVNKANRGMGVLENKEEGENSLHDERFMESTLMRCSCTPFRFPGNMGFSQNLFLIITALVVLADVATVCSNGQCRILDGCSSNQDCEAGLYCSSCLVGFSGSRCVRSTITNQFKLLEMYGYVIHLNGNVIIIPHLSIPMKELSCENNSGNLINMLHTCDGAAATRLINFVVVDYYNLQRSERGGSFQAMDLLNGKLSCGLDRLQEPALPGSIDNPID